MSGSSKPICIYTNNEKNEFESVLGKTRILEQ